MLILHAGESDGALALWGEGSRSEGGRRGPGRKPKAALAPAHPFAARARDVTTLLAEWASDVRPKSRRAGWMTAWNC